MAQGDLIGADAQPDLFGDHAPERKYVPDPVKVRARLHAILGEARAARAMPWEPAILDLYRTIFPQMSHWLPDDEAAQLRFEFESELTRLDAAA
jgi:hypothetical protein